ncbi:hypothetical protein FRB99_006238 [Tulasnella sp. 403]|nr:hypothetical protein FRB99_006238 [Tulasnella sp. 403]
MPPSTSSSSAPTTPDDEPLYRHVLPLSHPQSPDDLEMFEALVRFEDDFLACSGADIEVLTSLMRRFDNFQDRLQHLVPQNRLSQATIERWYYVVELSEAMVEAFLENLDTMAIVSQDLIGELGRVFDAEAASRLQTTKTKKPTPSTESSSSTSSPVVPKIKPPLQPQCLPSELRKTHRKRRVESGVPGHQSLKFRPCRDFFMENLGDPYPNGAQKAEIMKRADISATSLNQWFTNTRRRSQWMDIMKKYANNSREEMKRLVERALTPPDPHHPLSDEIREAVHKMRKHVDEMAREVISTDFLEALEELKSMTDREALRYHERQRQEKKRSNQVKKEAEAPPPDRGSKEVQPVEMLKPRIGEKRKLQLGPEDFGRRQRARRDPSYTPHPPPRPIRPMATPSKPRGVKRCRDASPPPPSTPPADAEPGSPEKKQRLSPDSDDEPHVPPKDLHRRRLGIPDLTAPLSAASTLLESDILGTPRGTISHISPNSSGYFHSEASKSSLGDELEWPPGNSMVSVDVPTAEAVVDPTDITFDDGTLDILRGDDGSGRLEWTGNAPPVTVSFANLLPKLSEHLSGLELDGAQEILWGGIEHSIPRMKMLSRSASATTLEDSPATNVRTDTPPTRPTRSANLPSSTDSAPRSTYPHEYIDDEGSSSYHPYQEERGIVGPSTPAQAPQRYEPYSECHPTYRSFADPPPGADVSTSGSVPYTPAAQHYDSREPVVYDMGRHPVGYPPPVPGQELKPDPYPSNWNPNQSYEEYLDRTPFIQPVQVPRPVYYTC